MRDTAKTIEFDFSFDYPKDGKYESAKAITVCEPGFDNRDVFRRMGAYISEAQKGLLKTFAGSGNTEIEEAVKERAEGVEPENAPEPDPLMTMRLGLSLDSYDQFMKYVERALTGNKMLAYVGTDPDNRVAINEEVWRNIAQHGGLVGMERVHAAFTSFFLATPQASGGSTKETGTGRSSLSGSTRAGSSRITKH